ncbi:MAG: hypothetical protein ABI672_21955 [Vicinamibacteria bacterium]
MQVLKTLGLAPALLAASLFALNLAFVESSLAPERPAANDNKGKKKSAAKKADKSDERFSESGASLDCQMQIVSVGLPDVTEASGVAIGRRTASVLWTHGDSYAGEPVLYAIDSKGVVKGKVRIEGIRVTDWEDIDVGPCGRSSCVYIADIGDNNGIRKNITIHRVPEPLPTDASARPGDSFQITFPDGPQDAEAMFLSSSGEMFIVTKGDTGPIAVYRLGGSPKPGSITQLKKVGVIQDGPVKRNEWITGASQSPDGKWIVMRTHHSVLFYEADRLMKGDMKSPLWSDVSSLREPQGEGIALGADGSVYLVGEGGRKGAAGTLATGTCKLPS